MVRRPQLRLDAAGDSAAQLRDPRPRGRLDRMSEGVVAGDEEPRLLAGLHDARHHGGRGGVGVVRPLHAGRRAGLVGELVGAGAGDQEDPAIGTYELLHRERCALAATIRYRLDAVIEPFAGERRRQCSGLF